MIVLYLFVFVVPVILVVPIISLIREMTFRREMFWQKFRDVYVRSLLISSRILDTIHLMIWTLCFIKAIEPYHDPAIINFMHYFTFAVLSLVLRGMITLFDHKYSLRVRYVADFIINLATIIMILPYGYNAITNL